jgi:hypothetical protein
MHALLGFRACYPIMILALMTHTHIMLLLLLLPADVNV